MTPGRLHYAWWSHRFARGTAPPWLRRFGVDGARDLAGPRTEKSARPHVPGGRRLRCTPSFGPKLPGYAPSDEFVPPLCRHPGCRPIRLPRHRGGGDGRRSGLATAARPGVRPRRCAAAAALERSRPLGLRRVADIPPINTASSVPSRARLSWRCHSQPRAACQCPC